MNVFEAVKQSVTTRQVAEHYGIKIRRNGMACCPFHNDKTPSMKVDTRYYCFGCKATGDVIDFVASLYGLAKYESAVKLANDFGIEYGSRHKKIKYPTRKTKPKQSYEKRFQLTRLKCIRILADYLHLLKKWKVVFVPMPEVET